MPCQLQQLNIRDERHLVSQHRKTSRIARRVAALGVTTTALLALAAGTAAASDDRCERADGVVVCLPADVDLSGMDVDVNILGYEDQGFPPVHLGP